MPRINSTLASTSSSGPLSVDASTAPNGWSSTTTPTARTSSPGSTICRACGWSSGGAGRGRRRPPRVSSRGSPRSGSRGPRTYRSRTCGDWCVSSRVIGSTSCDGRMAGTGWSGRSGSGGSRRRGCVRAGTSMRPGPRWSWSSTSSRARPQCWMCAGTGSPAGSCARWRRPGAPRSSTRSYSKSWSRSRGAIWSRRGICSRWSRSRWSTRRATRSGSPSTSNRGDAPPDASSGSQATTG